jgi:glycosyltransferase involved in cell wall biosynthesis/ubiquinone/menaquinone biosynthesis C-methylase UbiE
MSDAGTSHLRVLRIYHSGVVSSWRARDRELRRLGCDVRLLTSQRWNEGGTVVALDEGDDQFVTGVRTVGRHPSLFLYDPIGVWRALRAGTFDVLDIHEEPTSLAAAEVQLLARAARVRTPFALYSAQNIDKRYPVPFRWLERIALRRATAVHTCNDSVGDILRRKGFDGIVCNLGLGIDTEQFSPSRNLVESDRIRVGYVGRLEQHKGVDVLLDAAAEVGQCMVTVVGDGPDRSRLERRIEALGLNDRASMVGPADQSELPDHYRSFDVLAVPSLVTSSWIEQFGRVAVEAMACATPVIASTSGALPEVVDGAGVLCPPGDAHALAGAIEGLRRDRRELDRLAALARRRAEHFSWSNIACNQRALYREMLEIRNAVGWSGTNTGVPDHGPDTDLSVSAQPRYEFVRDLVLNDVPPPARVVELGAAPGDQIAALARAGYEATAVDIGIASDEWADGREGRMVNLLDTAGVRLVSWDLEQSPYPLEDDAFDAVVMTEVFEHLREYPIRSLHEAARVLRPGGRLYFTTPNAAYVKNRVELLLGRSVATPLDDWIGGLPHARHAREYTLGEIERLMQIARLQIVSMQSRHFFAGEGPAPKRVAKRGLDLMARMRPTFGPTIIVVAERPRQVGRATTSITSPRTA